MNTSALGHNPLSFLSFLLYSSALPPPVQPNRKNASQHDSLDTCILRTKLIHVNQTGPTQGQDK